MLPLEAKPQQQRQARASVLRHQTAIDGACPIRLLAQLPAHFLSLPVSSHRFLSLPVSSHRFLSLPVSSHRSSGRKT
jgi:hypothetical protein